MPEVPISIASVNLTGRYIRPDGTPLTGTLTFEPPAHLTFPDADVISFGAATVALDSTGAFSVSLIATDAAGGDPSDWTYTVVERLHQVHGRTFPIALPSATPTVDLADIAPTDPSEGDYVVITGPKGKDGTQIYNGSGAPSDVLGVNGDYYIDTTPGAVSLYGPKSAGSWPTSGVALNGVASVNGETGVVSLTAADVGADPAGTAAGLTAVGVTDWINVRKAPYSATGNGTSDDTAAIQNALNAAGTGGVVYLPAGTYRTSAPLVIPPGVTLRGSHGDHFDNLSGWTQVSARIKALSTFTGAAVILILDAPLGGYAAKSCEQRLYDLTLDGTALPAGNAVDGVQAQGTIRGLVFENLSIKKFGGHAVFFTYNFSAPAGLPQAPYSSRLRRVISSDCGGNAFSLNNTTDSTLIDVEAIGSAGYGFYLSGCGNTTLIGCRSEWNLKGFHLVPGNAQLSLIGCSTDRNAQGGILVTGGSAGATVVITNARLNRDGRNGGTGGGNYAGLMVDTCPGIVEASDVSVLTGIDDDSSGTRSPQYGVSVTGSTYVAVHSGVLNGMTAGWRDGGGNTRLQRGLNIRELVGDPASPTSAVDGGATLDGITNSLSVAGRALGVPKPSDHGLVAWTQDPATIGNGSAGVSGTLYLSAVYVPKYTTLTKIMWGINTAGVTPTAGQNFVGLYSAAGARLASVGVDARVTATGPFTETISVDVSPGLYWVAFLATATTMPQIYRGGTLSGGLHGANTSGATARFATNGTGQAALPATITPASNALTNLTFWAAVG
jgi:hypothetical protein